MNSCLQWATLTVVIDLYSKCVCYAKSVFFYRSKCWEEDTLVKVVYLKPQQVWVVVGVYNWKLQLSFTQVLNVAQTFTISQQWDSVKLELVAWIAESLHTIDIVMAGFSKFTSNPCRIYRGEAVWVHENR